jgi:hypothetical protein
MRKQTTPKISPELTTFMVVNNIATLKELIIIPDEVLVVMPGFGWHKLKEILLLREVQ